MRLQWDAVWRPAVSVSIFVLPLGLLQQWLVDRGSIEAGGGVSLVFYALILFLAAVTGYGGAKLAERDLLQHGAAAAALAYCIVQGVGITRRLIADEEISLLGYFYLALLMATCGMLGAMVERRARRLEALRD